MPDPSVTASYDHGPLGFRWLTLKRLQWTDPHGVKRTWESAERLTRSSSGVDGVAIIARVQAASAGPKIVIISQYRPPVGGYCLELPAGLVDEGETVGAAALRELQEETGYSGTIAHISPLCVSDPGMTNANMHAVVVDLRADAQRPQPILQDGEFIQVMLAPYGEELLDWLVQKRNVTECHIDARLLSFALGLRLAGWAGHQSPGRDALPVRQNSASASPVKEAPSSRDSRPFGSPVVTQRVLPFPHVVRSAPMGLVTPDDSVEARKWFALAGDDVSTVDRVPKEKLKPKGRGFGAVFCTLLDKKYIAGVLTALSVSAIASAVRR